MATLMLIDGNSLTYRAFHALPPDLATASGQVTNAVFGFTSMLINLVRDHRPEGIVVAFDRPEPTFRHERIDTYKANREKAPDVLREQMGLVRQVLEVLRLPTTELVGYEADDIIATLATRAEAEGHDVLIVTGDRDSYQLVHDPHVKVVYNKRGVSDYALYDEAGILERTGVKPSDYVAYAALRGDPSDNLPGIPGVGEKTAAKLINAYGGLDGIFANVDAQTPKLRSNLIEHEAQARSNLEVMELVRDAPIDVEPAALLEREPFDLDEVRKVFDFLEFRTLFERLSTAFPTETGGQSGSSSDTVLDATQASRTIADAMAALGNASHPVAVAGGYDGSVLTGMAMVESEDPTAAVDWVPIEHLDQTAPIFAADGPGVVAHHAKPLLRALLSRGVEIDGLRLDTALAAYLLDPAGSSYPLPELLPRFTPWRLPDDASPPAGQLDFGDAGVSPSLRAAREALAVGQLAPVLAAALADDGLDRLNDEVEVPLIAVLARMEHLGVGVDRAELDRAQRRDDGRSRAPGPADPRRRRGSLQRQLDQEAPGDPLRQPGPDQGQEDQDGLLDRPGHPREARR